MGGSALMEYVSFQFEPENKRIWRGEGPAHFKIPHLFIKNLYTEEELHGSLRKVLTAVPQLPLYTNTHCPKMGQTEDRTMTILSQF